jgi:hypothetical protein
MRPVPAVLIVFALLISTGCESKQQKSAALNAEYQTVNAQYQKECSASPSDQDANAILGGGLGSKPSAEQQAGIDQRQREAEARKNSPHCKELDAKRDDLTKKMLALQS